MSSDSLRVSYAQLMFYVREKYWRQAEQVCTDTINSTDDWVFRVWRGLCMDRQGLVNEALREYKAAEPRRETALPALMGMWLIYKRTKDQEGMTQVESKMASEKFESQVGEWIQAAALAWAAGEVYTARDKLLRFQETHASYRDDYTSLMTVRGWIELTHGASAFLEKCGAFFKKVIDDEAHVALDIDAVMGRVGYFERKCQFIPAQELLNRVIVTYPLFTPALVVKARLLMRAEDWDQAVETTKRLLEKDKSSIDALVLRALHALVKDARYAAAASYLDSLTSVVQEREPRNAALMLQLAQAFSRLSGGDSQVLHVTTRLAEQACTMDSRNGDYQCEVGYQQMYRGDYKNAMTTFKKAGAMTDDLSPLLGAIACEIHLGKLENAPKQVSFCNELQPSNQRNAELSWLNAVVLWQQKKDEAKSIQRLDEAAESIRQEIQSVPNGLDLYRKLNVPLMLAVAKEYMQHCRNEPPDPCLRRPDAVAEKCRRHLSLLLRHVPANMEAQIMLSRIHFVSGDLNEAQTIIKRCLQHEQPIPEAYLLSAQICQYMGNVKLAGQALEQALTLDFEIKDQPLFNVLQGIVFSMLNKPQQALEALGGALQIVKSPERVTGKGRPIRPLSLPDHVTLYLQLAQVNMRLRDVEEARRLLSEAANEFNGTSQSGRVSIAQAMLVARTDVDKSINILRQISSKSDFYVSARTQMAKLYLMHRQNRSKYAECFEEMVAEAPSVQSFVELGEAYTTIQEPEKAIAAYEKARALDPHNGELAVRIGRAMVATHNYEKAVGYYTDALAEDGRKFSVLADLAMLLWHLGQSTRALQVLNDAPVYKREPDNEECVSDAIERVNCALLKYKIQSGEMLDTAASTLLQARRFQHHVLESKLRNETRETLLQQKTVAATIDVELARYYIQVGEMTKAKEFLEEALRYDESNEGVMTEVARLSLRCGNLDGSEQQCNALLKMYPGCEEAVVLLAELMLRRDRFDEASMHFQQLLVANPDSYKVLVQYIQLLRRAGRLEEAEPLLEQASSRVATGQRPDPGLSYAHGLYHLYSSSKTDALRYFNMARLPSGNPWSKAALEKMIEIYLVPSTNDLWVATPPRKEKHDNARCAEQLLLQLPMGDTRRLLQGFSWLSTRAITGVTRALSLFHHMLQQSSGMGAPDERSTEGTEVSSERATPQVMDEDDLLLEGARKKSSSGAYPEISGLPDLLRRPRLSPAPLLGLAIGLTISANHDLAGQCLTRLFAEPEVPELTDVFVRARLLAAHLDMKADRMDTAKEYLEKVLEVDKGYGTAWVALGTLHERNRHHKEAALCYDNAWKLVKGVDPSVGYKLVFNYLQSNDPVKAIDVSKRVLAQHAGYPKIEEVVDVAYGMLRM